MTGRLPISVVSRILGLTVAIILPLVLISFPQAIASQLHWDIVSKSAVGYTPELVASTAVPKPHVDAIAQVNNTVFAGGLFDLVAMPGGSPAVNRRNVFAFDALTGELKSTQDAAYRDPEVDGQVWAIEAIGNSVFIGGTFTSVNGVARRNLVKIDVTTGEVDMAFDAKLRGGIVWDLQLWNGPNGSTPLLIVAGSMGRRLFSLNPATGAMTNHFDLGIADAIPNAWGGVAVYNVTLNPVDNKLVATGNFQTVQGQFRKRLFVVNLSDTASLDPWYYPGFAKDCSSTHPRRIAYLQGVDFSPDGRYFVVGATGQIPKEKADIWPTGSALHHTVCDAAGRFDLEDYTTPVWINYTGGDSVWAVADTGAAVYVQGHFQWLDNPNGFASRDGGGAVQRYGIGAIDPVKGKALPWNPAKPAQIGGKAFLATTSGLWVGSDSVKFDDDPHRGIAFIPVPLVMIGAGDIASCSVTTDELTAELVAKTQGVVFTLGDNAYQTGTAAEFENCYGAGWGAFKDRTRPSPGERDYLSPDAEAYFNYFGASAGPADKGYYSYDVGGWHIVVLNSMCENVGGCGSISPMITWLKADLEASTAKCTLAYFHHPRFSSGANGNNTKMRPAWNALYTARADIIINAHDNNYERFAPQQPGGEVNSVRGIRQFIVGTGGAALGSFGTVQPNSEVRNNDTFGVLRLKLGPASYEWNFLPAGSGAFTDSGTENCR